MVEHTHIVPEEDGNVTILYGPAPDCVWSEKIGEETIPTANLLISEYRKHHGFHDSLGALWSVLQDSESAGGLASPVIKFYFENHGNWVHAFTTHDLLEVFQGELTPELRETLMLEGFEDKQNIYWSCDG